MVQVHFLVREPLRYIPARRYWNRSKLEYSLPNETPCKKLTERIPGTLELLHRDYPRDVNQLLATPRLLFPELQASEKENRESKEAQQEVEPIFAPSTPETRVLRRKQQKKLRPQSEDENSLTLCVKWVYKEVEYAEEVENDSDIGQEMETFLDLSPTPSGPLVYRDQCQEAPKMGGLHHLPLEKFPVLEREKISNSVTNSSLGYRSVSQSEGSKKRLRETSDHWILREEENEDEDEDENVCYVDVDVDTKRDTKKLREE
ncbi:hypothetical protein G9A89_013625 [Geosiphon pyriformis]|nr:hypothetical protein G9A89_013625 [Geosiphon pyriformis]